MNNWKNPKYWIQPGWIHSKSDNQSHYINEHELARLYGVDPADCLCTAKMANWGAKFPDIIILRPRFDGNYTLPSA
jgi:hypothetical protein